MSALVILLGTRVRQQSRPLEFVRVWCPYCDGVHCYDPSSDGRIARCPVAPGEYRIRVVHWRVERLGTLESDTLPCV
jgi:hypothetical protein